jgi:hypothetical protein
MRATRSTAAQHGLANIYSAHHNPALYFSGLQGGRVDEAIAPAPACRTNDLPTGTTGPDDTSTFDAALRNGDVGAFNLIVPNDCENGHDLCGTHDRVRQFDDFLAREVPKIESSPAFGPDGTILITRAPTRHTTPATSCSPRSGRSSGPERSTVRATTTTGSNTRWPKASAWRPWHTRATPPRSNRSGDSGAAGVAARPCPHGRGGGRLNRRPGDGTVGRPSRGRRRRAGFDYVWIDPIAQLARRPRGSPFIRTARSGSIALRLGEDARAGD